MQKQTKEQIKKSILAFEKKYSFTVLDYATVKNFQPHETIAKAGEIIFGKDIKDLTKYPSAKKVGEIFLKLVPSLKIPDKRTDKNQKGAEAVLQLNDDENNALVLFYVENDPQNKAFETILQTYQELKASEFKLWQSLSQLLSKDPVDLPSVDALVEKSKTFKDVASYTKLQKLGLLDEKGKQRISELDVKNLSSLLDTTEFDNTQSKYTGIVTGIHNSVFEVEIYDVGGKHSAMIKVPEATDQYNYAIELFCALKMNDYENDCVINITVPENSHSIVDFGHKPIEIRPVRIEFPFTKEEIIQFFSELLGVSFNLR